LRFLKFCKNTQGLIVLKSHNIRLHLVIFLVLIPVFLLGQQSNSRLAFEYYNDQEWEKAAPLFLEMYAVNKAKPYLTYYVRCLIELKEYSVAEKEIKKAIRSNRDVTLNIDLSYLYELSNNDKKAADYLERPFKAFPTTVSGVKLLGNSYISYSKYDHALRVYDIARKTLNLADEFHHDKASIYSLQRRHSKMIDEYMALLLTQPRYLQTVQNSLQSALTHDIDKVIPDLTREKTLSYIQQFPGLDVFTEMLIWVYQQEGNYEQAVAQSMALDIRNRETGMRMLNLARLARAAGAFPPALQAYGYLIEKGEPPQQKGSSRSRPSQTPYNLALLENVQTQLQELELTNITDKTVLNNLVKVYEETLTRLNHPAQHAVLLKDLAYINTYYLFDYQIALAQIDSALIQPDIRPQFKAECLLDKGNILLVSGDPWEATFIYARVEKENAQNPSGSLAKFRKSQLAYFTGDFRWALAQLDVLKGSSSKLIANDAFEQAMLIRDNLSPSDSLNQGLKQLSQAEYLIFQKRIVESYLILDSLINADSSLMVKDDAMYKKAELLIHNEELELAKPLLLELCQNFRYEIWGHKALFFLGEIFYKQQNWEQALKYFEELVLEFPNSFYHLNAREYVREIISIMEEIKSGING
jgi:tetratricopeptide (TPR) repeat protein